MESNAAQENIITYVKEYGTYTFRQRPFCPVDSLVLSELSYLKYDHCASSIEEVQNHITLGEIAGLEEQALQQLFQGIMDKKANAELLRLAGSSTRFGGTEVSYYENLVEPEQETQFSAMVFILKGWMPFVAFRGTDETLAGWREDFNMAYMSPVPAQERARSYLQKVAPILMRESVFLMGGHSKGGNLAVYAATHADTKVQRAIEQIYNLDGPGFGRDMGKEGRYRYVSGKIRKMIPQSSIIGMMLENQVDYQVIRSSQEGILQHDPFSWVVEKGSFLYLEKLDTKAQIMGKTLYEWIMDMTVEERKRLIDLLFQVLSNEQITPLSIFSQDWKESVRQILDTMKELDEDTRSFVWEILLQLVRTGTKTAVNLTVEKTKETEPKRESKKDNRKELTSQVEL
ncbi:MAG: DUF2974 domain-containing protein [Lachnospiraceae bacterium]|nr:DUF2974 domain-containing protein [Lachnospiraceae bacterium]